MKRILILCLLLFTKHAYSQMGRGKPEDIQELKKRKMILIIEEPNKKEAERLKKKDKTSEVEVMKKRYDEFNQTVKEVFEKYWTMHKEINYMTWADFIKMEKKEKRNYGIMYFMSKKARSPIPEPTGGYYKVYGYTVLNDWMDNEKEADKHSFINLFQTFNIAKAEDVHNLSELTQYVYTLTLPEIYPHVTSIVYALKSTNIYFNRRMTGEGITKAINSEIMKNKALLKEKILVIRKDWMDDELSIEKIRSIYKYPVEIMDRESLDEILKSGDDKYAYFVIIPEVMSTSKHSTVVYYQYIIENKDGELMAMCDGKSKLTEKSLKRLLEK